MANGVSLTEARDGEGHHGAGEAYREEAMGQGGGVCPGVKQGALGRPRDGGQGPDV